jgi:glycosyltransferase involved in cell wall biosynthesis
MTSNRKGKSHRSKRRKQIKILFLTMYIYGMKTYTAEVVKRLQKRKWIDVKVIVYNSRFPLIGQILFHLRNIFRKYWQYDIIVSNNFVAPFLFSQRKIEIFHHSYYEIMKRVGYSLPNFIASILQVLSLIGASEVIVPSAATKETVPQILNRKKIHVVLNGIQFYEARRISHQEISKILELERMVGNIILSVGRETPHKGHERTLMAFIKANIDATLIFVGLKSNTVIHSVVTHLPNFRSRIIVVESVSTSLLHSLYAAADIYISLPYIEGFGFTFLEAMSQGTPVIAPNISPLTEIIGNAGILVSNINEAAIALYRLNADKKYREKIGLLGKRRSGNFKWDKSIISLVSVIRSMIKE